jgi:hypothetical protein
MHAVGLALPVQALTLKEAQELLAEDGADGDNFGTSAAASGDTALTGTWRNDNEIGSRAGAYEGLRATTLCTAGQILIRRSGEPYATP